MKRIICLALCIVMLCGVFTSCSTLKGDDKGAIIDVYLTDELYNFDPALSYTDDSMVKVLSLIYEGLTRLDSKGNWEKAMMDTYKYEKDEEEGEYKLTVEIADTKWSDGRTVQAADFVYAWKRILDPEFRGDSASLLYDIKNARDVKFGDMSVDDLGVTAVGTYTLQILFERDIDLDDFFTTAASVALVPLREDAVARNSEDWSKKTSTIVTNGPFALKEIEYGDLLRVERNAYYFRDVEKNERLDKYVIPWRIVTHYSYGDLEEQFNLFQNGQIFYLGNIPLSQRAAVQKQANISDELATHTYYFNLENPLFKDARVRRALSMALDRNEIVNILTYAKAATGLIPYGVYDANGKGDFRETADEAGALVSTAADVDGAKALLKQAGVTSGKFEITVKNNEADIAVAKYVAGVWNELGFKVTLNILSGTRATSVEMVENEVVKTKIFDDNYNNAYKNGDFDVIAVDMNMLTANAFNVLSVFATDFSGGGVDMRSKNYDVQGHITGYASDAYDELIEKVFAAQDSAERTSLMHDAEKMLMEDMPVIPLCYLQDAYLINTKVLSGVKDTVLGTRDFTGMKMKNYMAYKEIILAEEEAEAAETVK